MQTTRNLRSIQQPSRVDRLLHAFTTTSAGLTGTAIMIRDWAELPPVLRELISKGERTGDSWECWSDGVRTWLFTAEMSVPLSRERGSLVLRVSRYDEAGQLQETGSYASDKQGRWEQCSE